MLFDESSYAWFDAWGFSCSIRDAGAALYKSVSNLLSVYADMEEFDASYVEKDTSMIDDPMEVSFLVLFSPPSLPLALSLFNRFEICCEKERNFILFILNNIYVFLDCARYGCRCTWSVAGFFSNTLALLARQGNF